ncbi:MAG: alpha/beta hydrolase [Saprospiraceae bacterium]|nr:alpha/beta hydrolase [Saprospiraceae bacterium]
MKRAIKTDSRFKFIETNPGKPVLLLLHGLFGALSNFEGIIEEFNDYNVVVPILPIYKLEVAETGLAGLLQYTKDFVEHRDYVSIHLLGNSLGGHIAQLYVLSVPLRVKSLILTGSSGLFESGMGDGYPRRGDYGYIKRKTEETFYDPKVATKELVDEVYNTVNDREKALRIILTAKSAIKHNLADELQNIKVPTLLVWGKEDGVTPPFVGEKFLELIPNAILKMVDKCGHAPMMEKPKEFNIILRQFLHEVDGIN